VRGNWDKPISSPPVPVWPKDPNNLAVPLPWKHGSISLQFAAAMRVQEELLKSSYDVDLATAAEELRVRPANNESRDRRLKLVDY